MDDLLASRTRCPHCRAAVRPDAPWCTLCLADLRPAPEPPPPPPAPALSIPAGASYGLPALDPLTAPASALGLPPRRTEPPQDRPAELAPPAAAATWPCASCAAPNPFSESACTACGAPFLSALRGTEPPLLALPVVGDVSQLDRGQRTALAFGVVGAVVFLTVLLGLLVR